MSRSRAKTAVFVLSTGLSLHHLSSIPQKLMRQGWEVHVVTGDFATDLDEPTRQELWMHQIAIERRPHFIKDLGSILKLLRLIRSLNPSLVVTATPKASLLGQLAAYLSRVPSRVYFLWGLRLEGVMSPLLRVSVFLSEMLTSLLSTRILAVGKNLAERYVARGLSTKHKIRVIKSGSASGVRLERKSVVAARQLRDSVKESFSLKSELFTIGFVGRLTDEKGIHDFLEAFRILRAGGHKLQAIVVGRPETSAPLLLSQLESSSGIRYFPYLADIYDAYRTMDILVLPSAREGLPSVVIEAASLGVPSVIYPFLGWEDSIHNGVTGIVSSPDAKSLSQWIEHLMARPDFLSRMSKAARARAHEEFDKEKVERDIVDFLKNSIRSLQV